MAKCYEISKQCQHPLARLDYPFDWTRQFSRLWLRDYSFGLGVAVRPAGDPTGFEYLATVAGRSGAEEPAWPRAVGGTVKDGSIEWTAQLISVASLIETIASDTWTAPTGVTVTPIAPINTPGLQETNAWVENGETGTEYVIENEVVTSSGREYMARLLMTIQA